MKKKKEKEKEKSMKYMDQIWDFHTKEFLRGEEDFSRKTDVGFQIWGNLCFVCRRNFGIRSEKGENINYLGSIFNLILSHISRMIRINFN